MTETMIGHNRGGGVDINFSYSEVDYMCSLLRGAIRKGEKMQVHLQNKFGSRFDPEPGIQSREFRDRLYRKLCRLG